MPREDLDWALAEVRSAARRKERKLFRDYYDGKHPLAYSTKRFDTAFYKRFDKLADNLCPAVVDSVADRLKITGFSSSAARRRPVQSLLRRREVVSDKSGSRAWEIWRRNRMAARAKEVHREALKIGDAYVIVWPDRDGKAAIWPQVTDEIAIAYSETTPGELERAARVWLQTDGRLRANLYYVDRVERYIGPERPAIRRNWLLTSTIRETNTTAMQLLEEDGEFEHDYGRVPVFHFSNKTLWQPGVSELKDVPPLQDALNKTAADMLVSQEFTAYRQRWATGVEGELDESTGILKLKYNFGVDQVVGAEDAEARFGTFEASDLSQFIQAMEDWRGEIARVSGTPLHLFFLSKGDYPSGEAMKSAEARFSTKLEDRQESFGDTWEDALRFGLTIEGGRIGRDVTLDALWSPATPRSEEERVRTTVMKLKLISQRQGLRELDYNEDQIDQILEERASEASTAPAPDDGREEDELDDDSPIGDAE